MAEQFHDAPLRGEYHQQTFETLTWNVGGLSANRVLEVLEHFRESPELQHVHFVMLQEIITEAGSFHAESQQCQLVFGKCEGEFRGEGVAHRTTHKHQHTVVNTAGIATTLVTQRTTIRVLSGHIPHRATIPQTEAILHGWGDMLQGRVAVLGMDANETFRPPLAGRPGCYASTGRGEVILEWLLSMSLKFPPQDLATPTYHPYNTTMRPRRLDYIATKGGTPDPGRVIACKDRAASDHDGVLLPWGFHSGGGARRSTWGPRKLRPPHQTEKLLRVPPPTGEDPHQTLCAIAKAITVPGGRADTFRESKALVHHRKLAQQAPPGSPARQAWKSVSRLHKQEFRRWTKAQAERAAQLDWRALRSIQQPSTHRGWQLQLTDDANWQSTLQQHLKNIFAKPTPPAAQARRGILRHALRAKCKTTPWMPFLHHGGVAPHIPQVGTQP